MSTPPALAEVHNVKRQAEGHDGHAVDAEREGSPLGASGLGAEEAEVEESGQDEADGGGSSGADEREHWGEKS